MYKKTDDELDIELRNIRPANIGEYLIENRNEMIDEGRCFMKYMNTRQRDIIIRICYAAEFTLSETQQALTLYRMSLLYPRVARDALIMACFNNRPGSIIEVNEILLKNQMEPLRSSGIQN